MSKEYEKIRAKVATEFNVKIQDLNRQNSKLQAENNELKRQIKELEKYQHRYAKLMLLSKLSEEDMKVWDRLVKLKAGFSFSDEFLSALDSSSAIRFLKNGLD